MPSLEESLVSSAGSTGASRSADPESAVSTSLFASPSATVTTLRSTARPTYSETHATWSDGHEDNQTFPPMTTHWTAPQSCTWTYNVDNDLSSHTKGGIAWLDLEPIPDASTLSCYPDGMFFQGRTGVFSPGTCPNGWTTASLLVNTNEVRDEATTTAICCSSEYWLDGDICKRTVPTILAVPITYNHTARTYSVLSHSTTTLYSATIGLYTIRALFQEADKARLGLQDEDDIETEDNKTLSLGAKLGIGFGTGVFVLLLIAAGAIFVLRRDRARAKRQRAGELDAMQSRSNDEDGSHTTDEMHEMRDRCYDLPEPPPAYEPSPDATSFIENGGRLSGDTAIRDEEIQALRAQKEAIQRRLNELEQNESRQSQSHGLA